MKTLKQIIQENYKFRINRNTTLKYLNEEFENTFHEELSELSLTQFWTSTNSFEGVTLPKLHQQNKLNDIAAHYEDADISHNLIFFGQVHKDRHIKIYNMMMRFILENDDNIEYLVNFELNDDYYIRTFETEKYIITFVGPKEIESVHDDAHIIFQYKD